MSNEVLRTDEFGFGASALAAFESYCVMQRGTGRTSRLLDSLQPGDILVVMKAVECDRYSKLIKERGLKDVKVISIGDIKLLEDHLSREQGIARRPIRFRFHEAVAEKYTRRLLEHAVTRLSSVQERYSSTEAEFDQYLHDEMLRNRYGCIYSKAM